FSEEVVIFCLRVRSLLFLFVKGTYGCILGTLFRSVQSSVLQPDLFERSLEYEQERVAVTFRAIWRLVLALESWAGQTDTQRAALRHAISDIQGENQDLQLQFVEERRARLELV
ncbi:hypothetical protein Tco_1367028, partial [Tanacetum coccineum]